MTPLNFQKIECLIPARIQHSILQTNIPFLPITQSLYPVDW